MARSIIMNKQHRLELQGKLEILITENPLELRLINSYLETYDYIYGQDSYYDGYQKRYKNIVAKDIRLGF